MARAGKGQVKVKIALDPESIKAFREVIEFIAGLPKFNQREINRITGAINRGFLRNFNTESNEFGAWLPLSPVTKTIRQNMKVSSNKILVNTGSYRSSWITRSNPNHYENVTYGAGRMVIESGSQHPLAKIHEGWGNKKIKPREVVPLQRSSESEIGDVIDSIIEKRRLRKGA